MSPRITPADVDRVATLARLDLTASERERLAAELLTILDYAAQVLKVDTDGASPMSHVGAGGITPLRADDQRPSLPRDSVLDGSSGGDPSTGLFKVPRVLAP